MNMTLLKLLMYYSEQLKLATNASQRPPIWSVFQTRELLEWNRTFPLYSSQVTPLLACAAVSAALTQLRAITQKHLHVVCSQTSVTFLQRLCNFLAWR